jgi:SAM-dependent methyltransferase
MTDILKKTADFFTEKILEFGLTAKGVDWKDETAQYLRFPQLLKIINEDTFSINDLGCGYGVMFQYLKQNFDNFQYFGYDVSDEMIKNAVGLEKNSTNCFFYTINNASEMNIADYTVESGIFNKKFDYSTEEWRNHIIVTLNMMNKFSKKGLSFNMLTSYSDKDYMREDLYYADPLFFFDYCKRNFSKDVALLHDYNLYEFTILVRK